MSTFLASDLDSDWENVMDFIREIDRYFREVKYKMQHLEFLDMLNSGLLLNICKHKVFSVNEVIVLSVFVCTILSDI